jgi:hypothetical protein
MALFLAIIIALGLETRGYAGCSVSLERPSASSDQVGTHTHAQLRNRVFLLTGLLPSYDAVLPVQQLTIVGYIK